MNKKILYSAAAGLMTATAFPHALAASDADITALRQEIQAMRGAYEQRIADMEGQLQTMQRQNALQAQETAQQRKALPDQQAATQPQQPAFRQPPAAWSQQSAPTTTLQAPPATRAYSRRNIYDNAFNPSIGVVLNGQYNGFSAEENELEGFAVGHEGERPREGFAVDHTELNFSANADDKLFGSMTAAIADHEGETELELEEAFMQTLPGMGLPQGLSVKAGRAFWTLGYMNEHHSHADDFADRPLPYRVYLNGAYNDDGAELSYVLPTPFYSEIGGGAYRGDDFPFGEAKGEGVGAWSAYGRVGGDIGANQSWRVGLSTLQGQAQGGRMSNEEMVNFTGDSDLYVADARYTWAPTGNARQKELTLQGEYFRRYEDGAYEDSDAGTGAVNVDNHTSGWYAQGVYKFHPQWRVGARYAKMESAAAPAGLVGSALDADGYDPQSYASMIDWTNSEFSRVRFQYNYEEPTRSTDDHQFTLQYILSLGAHSAHKY